MKTIVVYDSLIETQESLDKLKNIFFLAEYKDELEFIAFQSITEYSVLLDYQAVFCLSDTYFHISDFYIKACNVPEFELSLKQYYDKKSQFLLYGLPFSCEDIYLPENKKHSWKLIQSFVNRFKLLEPVTPPVYTASDYTPTLSVEPVVEEFVETVQVVSSVEEVLPGIIENTEETTKFLATTVSTSFDPIVLQEIATTLKQLASLLENVTTNMLVPEGNYV